MLELSSRNLGTNRIHACHLSTRQEDRSTLWSTAYIDTACCAFEVHLFKFKFKLSVPSVQASNLGFCCPGVEHACLKTI